MNPRTTKSYLYEGIVIVASILVAFALDASWANFQDSQVERRVLVELQAEFVSAKARIESSITELEVVIDASLELAESLGKSTTALLPDTTIDLVIRILTLNTLEVSSSVLDSIIESGQVRLISSSELRNALANWPSFYSDVRENHEWHRVETDEFLIPYFARFLSIRDSMIRVSGMELTPGSFDYDVLTMQRDLVFEGRFVWRIRRHQATLDESKILLSQTKKLLALLDAEID